jgi:hypothetical protein
MRVDGRYEGGFRLVRTYATLSAVYLSLYHSMISHKTTWDCMIDMRMYVVGWRVDDALLVQALQCRNH